MDLLEAVLYGIVQGVTEWLPISSTAHLRILPEILGKPDPGAAFTAVIQLGTLLAVLIFFRGELWRALKGWAGSFTNPQLRGTHEAIMGWAIAVGTVPIVVFGVLFKDSIKGQLRSLYVVATMLIVVGILLWIAEKFAKQTRSLESFTVRDGLIIGLCQACALIPGASRSGSTMIGGLTLGFDRSTAAKASFLLSVPSIFAAGIKEFWDARQEILGAQLMPVLVATVVSFVVGYATIAWLIGYLQKRSVGVFVVYRVVLGIVLLVLLQTGKIEPMSGVSQEAANVSASTSRT